MTTDRSEAAPRIRRAPLPFDARVVRGVEEDEQEASIRQARLSRSRYTAWGRNGISGFLARSDEEVLDLGADRLMQFPWLRVFDLDVLVAGGFEVVPTFRSPHVTIAFDDAPELAVARLFGLPRGTVVNPAYCEEP